jgi:hypothetical protein
MKPKINSSCTKTIRLALRLLVLSTSSVHYSSPNPLSPAPSLTISSQIALDRTAARGSDTERPRMRSQVQIKHWRPHAGTASSISTKWPRPVQHASCYRSVCRGDARFKGPGHVVRAYLLPGSTPQAIGTRFFLYIVYGQRPITTDHSIWPPKDSNTYSRNRCV